MAAELITATSVSGLPTHDAPAAATIAPMTGAAATEKIIGDRTIRLRNLGGPSATHLLSRIAADSSAAIDAVVVFWGVDWSHEISVVAAGTREQFASAAGGPAWQWADIAAVTLVDRVDPVSRQVAGQRIVFAPEADQMSDSALRIVLTHELFHYAARADTALDAPRWLIEGVADFVARPDAEVPASKSSLGSTPTSLPSDADVDTPGAQRSLAYDRAWLFARFVADAYGSAKLRELYLSACGVGHADLPTALHSVLGVGSADLLARWRQWLGR